ncbi:hypothetical protein PoB_005495200 [Plakobranchus ocellatus]|uniref:Uncharacterized protein n=1 Tax=Plakobranchus ocellatus TaxID=259542 RepID=A0AAV4CAP5_9GAST|nr:hypothetical protein PoB_005495200 [Plakobranchus ocellatus]
MVYWAISFLKDYIKFNISQQNSWTGFPRKRKEANQGGVGSTVACESALRSAGTLLSRVRAPLPAPWPDGGPESLRSPCCGLAVYKNPVLL